MQTLTPDILRLVNRHPNRGDKRGLREVFDNVADQVRLGGDRLGPSLVPPRTSLSMWALQDKLRAVAQVSGRTFDMGRGSRSIMDRAASDARGHPALEGKGARARRRNMSTGKPVVFCSTVAPRRPCTEGLQTPPDVGCRADPW